MNRGNNIPELYLERAFIMSSYGMQNKADKLRCNRVNEGLY